jgi:hypothetical protein
LPDRELRFPLFAIRFAASGIVIAEQGIGFLESLASLRIRQIYNLQPLCPSTHAPDCSPMAAGTRNVRIFVSEQCFDLLVDAMAAYSKESRRFQTMRTTVQAACSRLKSHGISKQELDDFLAEYDIGGDIRIFLEVGPEWSQDYDAVRTKVKEINEKPGLDKILVPFAVYLAVKHNLL